MAPIALSVNVALTEILSQVIDVEGSDLVVDLSEPDDGVAPSLAGQPTGRVSCR